MASASMPCMAEAERRKQVSAHQSHFLAHTPPTNPNTQVQLTKLAHTPTNPNTQVQLTKVISKNRPIVQESSRYAIMMGPRGSGLMLMMFSMPPARKFKLSLPEIERASDREREREGERGGGREEDRELVSILFPRLPELQQ